MSWFLVFTRIQKAAFYQYFLHPLPILSPRTICANKLGLQKQ
ncbi:hypothetical protein M23134_05917 [Microscilla marina ATCC 23134]|uniref:Uncharacterized protein n=1 Tax=Microscilla marina ATCC 23134 TaxID=313606 RepID=A1ZWW9_MICM2|nr:hypothetical protein M23134_05917 [Microscilla marina ATCC 23134]